MSNVESNESRHISLMETQYQLKKQLAISVAFVVGPFCSGIVRKNKELSMDRIELFLQYHGSYQAFHTFHTIHAGRTPYYCTYLDYSHWLHRNAQATG
jgi:hypothetical protein